MPSPGDGLRPRLAAIALRALVYAIMMATLVVCAPGRDHVFIYQGF
jgi:hypothetical protein